MSWRTVLISGRAKLDLKLNNMIIRKEEIKSIHIPEIAILIIDSTTVSITTALIDKLVENKIKILFTGKDHNLIGEVVNYYNKHNSVISIKKQINWKKEIKDVVWRKIVRLKIYMQAKHISFFDEDAYAMLKNYTKEVQLGDVTNREGHAAKVYFKTIFGKDFSRKKDNPINAMLNYGYAILLSTFVREINSSGYITQLGIFHDNQFNYFNLASDFMEPYRPLVDSIVYSHLPDKFESLQKYQILDIFNKEILVNDKKCTLINSISLYCRGIFNALNENDENLMNLIDYEL